MVTDEDVVKRYYDSWNYKLGEGLADLIAEDVSYVGPIEQVAGAPALIEMAAKFAPMHGGMKILHQFRDGDDICTIYDLKVNGPGWSMDIPTADWITLRDGRVARQRVFQDVREVLAKL